MATETLVAWATAANAIVALCLVGVTWRYASSTDRIARDTARAAEFAELAAQVTLAQSAWSLQPKLSIRRWALTVTGQNGQPTLATVTFCNTGSAPAERPDLSLLVQGRTFAPAEPPPSAVQPGEEFGARFVPRVAQAVRTTGDTLALRVEYSDSLGSVIVDLYSSSMQDGGQTPRSVASTYDGGASIDGRIRALLRRLDPE